VNIKLAQEIMDSKPAHSAHLYVDEDHVVRDRHIEAMFRDLFHGNRIDKLFINNFTVYFDALTKAPKRRKKIPLQVFIDFEVASLWVSHNLGIIHTAPADRNITCSDPDLDHCNYVTVIRTKYAPDLQDGAYAPTKLNSILLSAVLVFRAIAQSHIDYAFAEAINH
jgi:hypothetical protein